MRKLFSHSIIKIVAILSLTPLVQATQFHLPPGTPGLQKRKTGSVFRAMHDEKPVNTVNVNCEKVKCVDIHDSQRNIELYLYFPVNGVQPTTAEAGEYSGARYNGPRKDDVTDWWVRVFGGNRAVNWSRQANQQLQNQPVEVPMGFDNLNNPVHIVQVNTAGAPANFEQDFWQTFRQIAADPVGRVLLYRLLIEIRRLDNAGIQGCWEDGVTTTNLILENRNKTRSINVYSNGKSTFNFSKRRINIFLQNKILQTFKIENGYLTTAGENRTGDIALFHEMLHWFHNLRHRQRCLDNMQINGFKYNTRCYYGSGYELFVWGAKIKEEEIATILGAPNYRQAEHVNLMPEKCFSHNDPGDSFYIENLGYIQQSDKFLNGDDLSENAYRVSKGCHMRFGHSDRPIKPVTINPIPDRIQLAHQVAVTCYTQITGNVPQGWNLQQGEAIQP